MDREATARLQSEVSSHREYIIRGRGRQAVMVGPISAKTNIPKQVSQFAQG
jgi:hypothetical protein